MPMCDFCERIVQRSSGEDGHGDLVKIGHRAMRKMSVEIFQCMTCGTVWNYENDRDDDYVGWRVSPDGNIT